MKLNRICTTRGTVSKVEETANSVGASLYSACGTGLTARTDNQGDTQQKFKQEI